MTWWQWLLISAGVLAAAAVYDFAIARYQAACADRLAISAAAWSVTTYLVGLVGLASVLRVSPWLIIPECVGMAIGTYAGVRWRR